MNSEASAARRSRPADTQQRQIVLFGDPATPTDLLGRHFALADANPDREAANIIGVGAGAGAAVAFAAANGRAVDRLILMSPELATAAPLAAVDAPTLVIVGSKDAAGAAVARRCAEEMPSCYLMFVYDTDRDPAQERPEATLDLVSQFLTLGETFPVRTESYIIQP